MNEIKERSFEIIGFKKRISTKVTTDNNLTRSEKEKIINEGKMNFREKTKKVLLKYEFEPVSSVYSKVVITKYFWTFIIIGERYLWHLLLRFLMWDSMALAIHLMYLTPMSINVGKDAAVAKQLIKIQILGVIQY